MTAAELRLEKRLCLHDGDRSFLDRLHEICVRLGIIAEAELKRFVSIAAFGAALISAQAAASDLPPSEANAGKEAIELHYINQKIYSPVICDEREIDGTAFVNCGPSRGDVDGGLWAIEAGPTVLAVNGKALQHADSIGTTIFDADGKNVKYAEWRKAHPDKPINVVNVLKAFQ